MNFADNNKYIEIFHILLEMQSITFTVLPNHMQQAST
jgi:hypothetical protein